MVAVKLKVPATSPRSSLPITFPNLAPQFPRSGLLTSKVRSIAPSNAITNPSGEGVGRLQITTAHQLVFSSEQKFNFWGDKIRIFITHCYWFKGVERVQQRYNYFIKDMKSLIRICAGNNWSPINWFETRKERSVLCRSTTTESTNCFLFVWRK